MLELVQCILPILGIKNLNSVDLETEIFAVYCGEESKIYSSDSHVSFSGP